MAKQFTWIDALIIIMFVVVVYMVLTRLFGHSATDLAITFGLFSLLIINQYKINREVGELQLSTKHSFMLAKIDMNAVKENMGALKDGVEALRKEQKQMRALLEKKFTSSI